MTKFYPILNEDDQSAPQSNDANNSLPINIGELLKLPGANGSIIDMAGLKKQISTIKVMIAAQDPLIAPYVHDLTTLFTWSVETMATDGSFVYINPEWTSKLSFNEKAFVLYHEIFHCLLDHMKRGKAYNHDKFNRAGDYEINAILIDQYEDFPENIMLGGLDGLYDKKFLNMSAEQIYPLIADKDGDNKSKPKTGPSNGDGEGKPGDGEGRSASEIGAAKPADEILKKRVAEEAGSRPGGMISKELGKQIAKNSGLTDAEIAANSNNEEDWDKKSKELLDRSIAQDRKNGRTATGGGSMLAKILGEYHNSVVDWKDILSMYVGNIISKKDRRWTMPNRKYMANDRKNIRIRQVTHGKEISTIFVCVDTSGSMGDDIIRGVIQEIAGIVESQAAREIELILFNSKVYKCQTIQTDSPLQDLYIAPGGGTDFDAPLDYISKNYDDDVAVCIFFTDGDAPIPEAPDYEDDFIWVIYDSPNWPNISGVGTNPPFGQKILVTSENIKKGIKQFVKESVTFFGRLVTENIKRYIR